MDPGSYELDGEATYWDVAVSDSHAYLVDGRLGVNQIQVVDLSTLEIVDRWDAIDDRPAVPAGEQDADDRSDLELHGVQVLDDGQVVVFGRRDDAYAINPVDDFLGGGSHWQFSFVVQGLSADGTTAEWSLALDLRGAVSPTSSIIQKETMQAFVDGDTIAITFSHLNQPDRVFTIPRPTGHEMYQLVDWGGVDIPVAPITPLATVDVPRGIAPAGDGSYLVTGADGLFRVTADGAELLADGEDGYFRDLRVQDGMAFVADYGFGLRVLSASSGAEVGAVELDHYDTGLDILGQQVVVGAETGMTVIDIAWDASDDTGGGSTDTDDSGGGSTDTDDTSNDGDSNDDVSCQWVWKLWYWDWVCG
jgi:hypothetical protein